MRYGLIFRGNKVLSAESRGAVGVLIYYEPDAPSPNGVYPKGPWRTNTTVQRGSINMGDGDPETPGWPSTWNGPRYILTFFSPRLLNPKIFYTPIFLQQIHIKFSPTPEPIFFYPPPQNFQF
jgi:hypothetical protein